MVPAFWSWIACAMFWLCHLPAVTLDGYQSFSVLLFPYPGDPRAVRSIKHVMYLEDKTVTRYSGDGECGSPQLTACYWGSCLPCSPQGLW